MLQVSKTEPKFFSDKKKKILKPKESDAWSELGDIRADLREYILENEQSSMCAYCEKKITSDSKKSNIDHYKTRNLHPELTLDYNNFFVSCNNLNHCSSKKDNIGLNKNDYENMMNPLDKDLDENFSYALGEIEGKNKKANFTIDTFALNNISLVEERKEIIRNFEFYKEFDEITLVDAFRGHVNLIRYLKNME